MPGAGRFLLIGERAAVNEEHIRPPVVVVIKNDAAAGHGFRHVLLGSSAILVFESDLRFRRDVDESHGQLLLRGAIDPEKIDGPRNDRKSQRQSH